jgi:hypothetical protein
MTSRFRTYLPGFSIPSANSAVRQAGIDAFLRYADEHSQGFLTAYRGTLSGDVEVRAIIEQARQRQSARIPATVTGEAEAPPLLCRRSVAVSRSPRT